MKIRKIRKTDLPACGEILEKAYGRPLYNEVFKDSNARLYIEGKYKSCKEDSFVAVDDNKVVAFIFLKISTWSEGLQAVLEEIAVDPDFQGSGIGKKLMEYAHNYLRSLNIKSVMLWAKKDSRLIKFYEEKGYFLADDFVVMFKNF
jgi:ribosomal protein S18 acetylase RimI-like enzyme